MERCQDTQEPENSAESALTELLSIMTRLRAPDGCPWDRVQTHASIRPNLIEEAYEVADAIDSGDRTLLLEELGDLLLQVVFHAQIESEQGGFTMDDVIRALNQKLITRHEHVFGETKAKNADDALDRWEAVKRRTKKEKTDTERLLAVPRTLPALARAAKLRSRAAKAGYQALPDTSTPGDALFRLAIATAEAGTDPEEALDKVCTDFICDFTTWEQKQQR